jgi:hypothetical protein
LTLRSGGAHFDNLQTLRYLRIAGVSVNGITGNLSANVYNTTFASGYDIQSVISHSAA